MDNMLRPVRKTRWAVLIALAVASAGAQAPKATALASSVSSVQRGISLSESGHCAEALPLLRKVAHPVSDKELQRKAGLAAVRCAMTLDQRAAALDALQWLNREFPHDPDVLYVSTHAYSDLSTRESVDLAQAAPGSYQAHELNAEALEMQGKWDQAAQEYAQILKNNPRLPGIHFRLGRLLLSKPDPGPSVADEAKKEFEEELKIDPSNAGAEYVLGELASQTQQWDEAVEHFSRAANFDPGFGDAYLGQGAALIAARKFADAIGPLETAVKIEPGNPTAHYSLATAYSRVGRKPEADREFAVHQHLTEDKGVAAKSPQTAQPADPQ
jgi:tetratricopeptide (TPR) repeat protein